MITKKLIAQYYRLILHETAQKYAIAQISGNEVKYPHQVIYKQVEGKEETEYKYLTHEQLEASIESNLSLGVMLTQNKTGLCKSGCIDIDCPRDATDLKEGLVLTQRLQKTALKLNLRAYIEFSGNRGYHLWIFANKPVIGEVMQNCLKAIAQLAKNSGKLPDSFEIKEIFPNKYPQESKVIKLPFTTHLKSSLRSGFIGSNFDVNNPQIELPSQVELMANIAQNDVIDILECAKSLNYQNFDNSKEIYQGINSDNRYITKSLNSNTANSHNSYSQNKPVNQDEITSKLNSFGDKHPSCINFLLNNGAPLEIEYNQANLTLVRYCLTRGFNLEDSLPLAELMAKNTSENHSTSKDYQGKINNFKSVFQSASRNSEDYLFDCGYVLSGYKRGNKGKLSDRGCIGSKCSLFKVKDNNSAKYPYKPDNISHNGNYSNNGNYPQNFYNQDYQSQSDNYKNISNTVRHYPLPSLIFEAMINLTNQDKEICKSNLLLTIEPQYLALIRESHHEGVNEVKFINRGTDSLKLLENEVLAYLIQNSDIVSDYLEIFPQGFITTTDKRLSEYIDYLLTLELPSEDTIEAHIDLIREKGIKAIASNNYSRYIHQLREAEYLTNDSTNNNKINSNSHKSNSSDSLQAIDILTKTIDDTESLLKQSLSDKTLLSVEDRLIALVEALVSEEKIFIPTPSKDLNHLLNGGLMPSRLYVLGSGPGNGKSTLCCQIAENACQLGFKVGYASYEMSLEQIFITSLSRLAQLNSSYIEGKTFLKFSILKKQVFNAITKYKKTIAPNLHIIEADDLYNPKRLLGVCKKLNLDLLIVDYLQLLSTGDEKLDNSSFETAKISKIATELKRISRKAKIPIIAISDINKEGYNKTNNGGDLNLGSLRDSFKIAHSADVVMLLKSEIVEKEISDSDGSGKTYKKKAKLNQLEILAKKADLMRQNQLEQLSYKFPLRSGSNDTYSVITIEKNRTGKRGDILFRYAKALHYFEPICLGLDQVDKDTENF
ncbi:replicative DNA helicase (DnaB) (plasmid) [Geminocystis sp. NIES-3708]|uniref:DnaB-like helicase C-terminal domain-containing protein n=1 Tax=Geminocystis sp. NIES-3708 TaxID=1615909 RepID=UPI0005FCCB48|nr:DnaB-like helicase C-terminal domain-containing protein [Geminocystis sp. NIES-3708]BAQ63230.1 replicative DNA helicase (DnaB) [Geminocystis sp. NIES-3708]